MDEAFDQDPRRWGMLVLVSMALLLGMSAWFTAAAVAPELQARWGLDGVQVGWLTTVVQLGFVTGTAVAALVSLADITPSRVYFALSAALAAVANAALVLALGYDAALAARFLTGLFLAGVYPPAMKMIATWFRSARGLAIGTVVGALTVGKATPYLLKAVGGARSDVVVLGASLAGVVAAALILTGYREGPYGFGRSAFSWGRVGQIFRHRPTMLATGGYLGHMWELYAMWTWVPAFLLAGAAAAGAGVGEGWVDLAGFGAIAAGGVGCVWGGWAADRIGRERVTIVAMALSGACSVLAGLVYGSSFSVLVVITLVWGFFVVADSAQFSALVTEVAPADSVGTALTLQTSLGFLLTMVTIQMVPVLEERIGWRWAFTFLVLGPLMGIVSMRALRRLRSLAAPG